MYCLKVMCVPKMVKINNHQCNVIKVLNVYTSSSSYPYYYAFGIQCKFFFNSIFLEEKNYSLIFEWLSLNLPWLKKQKNRKWCSTLIDPLVSKRELEADFKIEYLQLYNNNFKATFLIRCSKLVKLSKYSS